MPDRFLGQRLGDYIVEERIGRGAMAVVYRAYQPAVQRQVALKIIHLDGGIGEDDDFQMRFAQEAEVIAALEHIHILPIFDYGIVNEEIAFIAMRLLRGGTLADLLHDGPLPIDRAADIITQVARGLAHAHRHGVIHRDLKPSNILFDNSGNAYLTDFGLAKVVTTPDMTKPGNLVGTPAYVSPEALRGEVIDQRADVYSLGILTYEVLTGRLPFEAVGGNILSLIRMHMEEEPPKLRQFNPAIPPEVETVVLRALRKDPRQRYEDAEAMADALNAALGRHYSTGSSPQIRVPLRQRTVTVERLRETPVTLTLVVAVLLTILGLLVAFQAAQPPERFMANATIVTGASGVAADALASEEEKNNARSRLGADGFIAFITCTLESEFQVIRAREMGDLAARFELAYRVYDGESSAYNQITLIERARAEGAQAFILCPLDADLLQPTLESLKEAAIPLVLTTVFAPSYGVMLDSDNMATGRQAGELAGSIIRDEMNGEADVVVLAFPGAASSELRVQGMQEGLRAYAPGANVIGVWQGFTRELAYQVVKTLLEEQTHFDVILSINDNAAFGAIDALEESGVAADEVVISSINGESLALEYIAESHYLRGTVRIDRAEGSRIALNAVVRLLAGATLPETIVFPPGEVITRETLS